MKYAILIPDGCADHPEDFPDSRTALVEARIPHMDALARSGIVGRSFNVPPQLPPGSDVATLSVLGYDPEQGYTGRAPLEAAAQGIPLGENDWAFRCNMVNISDDGLMKSFTAGHISSEEAAELLKTTGPEIVRTAGEKTVKFYPGVSYRNLMIYRGGNSGDSPFDQTTQTVPPHDYTDQSILSVLPQGAGGEFLRQLMDKSRELFADHPVNRRRIHGGQCPASQFWLWGQGKRPDLVPFAERFPGVRGSMISAVDLLIGIAKLIGWTQIQVPGITGYVDTDYAAKGRYAAKALEDFDLVCVHVEAPDEASHEGSSEKKVHALEEIDRHVLPPILEKLQSSGDWRIFITPDHPTSLKTKTHSHRMVPWIIAGSDVTPDHAECYSEQTAQESRRFMPSGWQLMERFIGIKPL
ncbi:MAG: cofactor-independent phosphoglycerate mutase [Planctomycetaceae bacterium]|jgi:2,3-bisphosphoglycerate-independent phosphoglycerate mutase|nr:cofactor-independent phosphoglycerate mutase [Planctomycetaceae bacterium]